jgi:hypothetical protein
MTRTWLASPPPSLRGRHIMPYFPAFTHDKSRSSMI